MYEEVNRDFEETYQKWHDGLQNVRNLNQVEIFYAEFRESCLRLLVLLREKRNTLSKTRKNISEDIERTKKELKLMKLLERLKRRFCAKTLETCERIRALKRRFRIQGLTPEIIQRFQLFTCDETQVGSHCPVCMEDVEVGRRMMRLTCDGRHTFCQECIEGWFADHNTCPVCRHTFV